MEKRVEKEVVGTLVLNNNIYDLDDFASVLFANNYSIKMSKDEMSDKFIVDILKED